MSRFYFLRSGSAHWALIWLSGGSGFPRWCPVVRPKGCDSRSSITFGNIMKPPWNVRSKSSQGAKVKGFSTNSPLSRARHPSNMAVLTGRGQWAGLQNTWGGRTWKPQKWRVPFWKKQDETRDINNRPAAQRELCVCVSPVEATAWRWCLRWCRRVWTSSVLLQLWTTTSLSFPARNIEILFSPEVSSWTWTTWRVHTAADTWRESECDDTREHSVCHLWRC